MISDNHEKPGYYSILPATVRYDNRLRANEKILYSEITALANKNGYCSAGNGYFADLYEVKKETISEWISNLKKYGYLAITNLYFEGTQAIQMRKIYIRDTPSDKTEEVFRKNGGGYSDKTEGPLPKKPKENNTSNNNTSDNRISSTHIQDILSMWNALDKNIPEVKALNAGTTRYKNLKARINQYGEESIINAIDNIANSQFLKGYVNDFTITFDRFVRPNNFPKVLEGNYNDKDINTNNNVSVIRSDTSRKGYADRARAERFAKMMEER